jgi:hypothetical protein
MNDMNDMGKNQFRVTFDHLRRPRLEPLLMSNNISNDVFNTAGDETINPTEQVTLINDDGGDNGNYAEGGTQGVPPVSPSSDQETDAEGGNASVGAEPSDVGSDTNKHDSDVQKEGDRSTSDEDDINIEINMHIDDGKSDGKGDVTSRSTFQRIKHALTHMRKKMKDTILKLRMSEYFLHFSELCFLFFLFGDGLIYDIKKYQTHILNFRRNRGRVCVSQSWIIR